ncbi:hypothetical protein [Pantoea sp. 1.19]|uniref:hypothetical protein n=1 Tax=Pantoea sp. 1.19 TaxID=1925589 RepID=UPI00147E7649|nr:hypothetical protein [Pantoea sp. 1.19]
MMNNVAKMLPPTFLLKNIAKIAPTFLPRTLRHGRHFKGFLSGMPALARCGRCRAKPAGGAEEEKVNAGELTLFYTSQDKAGRTG